MIELTVQETLQLLALASKVCEFADELTFIDPVARQREFAQIIPIIHETEKVLVRVDQDFPGFVPVPHDGGPWAERLQK